MNLHGAFRYVGYLVILLGLGLTTRDIGMVSQLPLPAALVILLSERGQHTRAPGPSLFVANIISLIVFFTVFVIASVVCIADLIRNYHPSAATLTWAILLAVYPAALLGKHIIDELKTRKIGTGGGAIPSP